MHETSIIAYVLQMVEDAAKSNGMTKVVQIDLSIGKMRSALPDVLKDSFRFLTDNAMFKGATLEIEELDIVFHCDRCGKDTTVESGFAPILCCEEPQLRMRQGNELLVSSFRGY